MAPQITGSPHGGNTPQSPQASVGVGGSSPSSRRRGLFTPQHAPGRNLSQAIPVGIALGIIVLVGAFFAPVGWYVVVAGAVAVATWEVTCRLRQAGWVIPLPLLLVVGQSMVWLSWPYGIAGTAVAFAAGVLAVMAVRLFLRSASPQADAGHYLRDMATSIFLLCWIPLCGAFAAMICLMGRHGVSGSLWIVSFMLCVVANDVGGYTAGVFAGRHPLAPAVSPKKSWEGFAGSLVAGAIVGALCASLLVREPWWAGLIIGAFLALCATMGDLVESQVKRDLAIKDMSRLIPGHGGLMDRLDGVLPAAAVTWLLLALMMGL